MGERCYSTLVCAERDKGVFEKMGYRLEESQALTADGNEIPRAVVMVEEVANNGNYDELTGLMGFLSLRVTARVLVLTATTSLFRMERNGTTPKPCMRATTPLYEWNSAAGSGTQKWMTLPNIGRYIQLLWRRLALEASSASPVREGV